MQDLDKIKEDLFGLTIEEAYTLLQGTKYNLRVRRENVVNYIGTNDLDLYRINVHLKDKKICHVELG